MNYELWTISALVRRISLGRFIHGICSLGPTALAEGLRHS